MSSRLNQKKYVISTERSEWRDLHQPAPYQANCWRSFGYAQDDSPLGLDGSPLGLDGSPLGLDGSPLGLDDSPLGLDDSLSSLNDSMLNLNNRLNLLRR